MDPKVLLLAALPFVANSAEIPDGRDCTTRLVQGTTLYCCTLPNGQKCCSQSTDDDGTVSGCGCKKP